jgi:hypothetical protein
MRWLSGTKRKEIEWDIESVWYCDRMNNETTKFCPFPSQDERAILLTLLSYRYVTLLARIILDRNFDSYIGKIPWHLSLFVLPQPQNL